MKVTTVLGDVKFSDLGVTLTHEHFNIDFSKFYSRPCPQLERFFTGNITLENVGFIKQYPYWSRTNVDFQGEDVDKAIIQEMKMYKEFGGNTIVENTNHGIRRNLPLMVEVAKQTGVNVIAGTGYYVADVQTQSTLNKKVEDLCLTIRNDMIIGCEEMKNVKCGFIGEVGSGWPIKDFERRAIVAAAVIQAELGCAVSFHPGRHPDAPGEIIRLYGEAGGDVKKADMSHLDRTLKTEEQLLEFAKLGTYCQFDLFGIECSLYQLDTKSDMPSDAQRIDRIKALINEGKEDKILVSHDIHTKHRLVNFGGHGFSHLISNVKFQMGNKGMDKTTIDQIMISNPANWICSN